MNLVFLGPPGSGKGTQASILSRKFLIPQISTGDMLRSEVEACSDLGAKVSLVLQSGGLVDDDIVFKILLKRIKKNDCSKGFILDGFPRSLSQAVLLDEVLEKEAKKLSLIFNFEINQREILQRLLGRFSCKECKAVYNKFFSKTKLDGVCDFCGSKVFDYRTDDDESIIRNRLRIYEESIGALVDFYKKRNGLLVSIDAASSKELLSEELIKIITTKL